MAVKKKSARKKTPRIKVMLQSTESHWVYYTYRNTRNTTEKLSLNKFDPVVNRTVRFAEKKMPRDKK